MATGRDNYTWPEIVLVLAVMVFALKGTRKMDARTQQIATYYGIDYGWAAEVVKTSRELGTNPWWLAAVISLESTWQPEARNDVTDATGLIQFIPSTARSLGTTVDIIRDMSVRDQFRLIRRYFGREHSGRTTYPTFQTIAMQVFYPAARSWDRDREFSARVQESNPNIRTVGDYLDYAERRLPREMRSDVDSQATIDVAWVQA